MASDQLVSARDVLDALTEVKRRGRERCMEELDQVEPDLASFVMESLSEIHRLIMDLHGKPKQSRRLQCRVETLVLVSLFAVRKAGYRSWCADAAGTPLAELAEASSDAPTPTSTAGESAPAPDEDGERANGGIVE